ncbi:MAG TPA: YceI family protein [Salinimicrobium sp.]|nr:YceI family protein [Salinimicrobium sp.]
MLSAQKFYKATAVEADFFSSAPIEDIHAASKKGISVLNSETGEISFKINTNTFQFPKSLMQEHFNEKFIESDKYPAATFRGNIKNPINFNRNGEYSVILLGVLDIHGIKNNREIPAEIIVQNGKISLKSNFQVACKDHNIKIPQILWQNIAEVVEVKVNANYIPIEK